MQEKLNKDLKRELNEELKEEMVTVKKYVHSSQIVIIPDGESSEDSIFNGEFDKMSFP